MSRIMSVMEIECRNLVSTLAGEFVVDDYPATYKHLPGYYDGMPSEELREVIRKNYISSTATWQDPKFITDPFLQTYQGVILHPVAKGPDIYIDTCARIVYGIWGDNIVCLPFVDEIGLHSAWRELFPAHKVRREE